VKLPFSIRASLSLSMVGLAVLVAVLAIGVHMALAVQGIVHASAERSRALAQQTAWLASRVAPTGRSAESAIRNDRALEALFESALAGDPTVYDLAIVDRRGTVLIQSQELRVGRQAAIRPSIDALEEGNVLVQGARLLGPSRAYEVRVPMHSDGRPFGEVRIGVSTALMKTALLESLRAGLWVTAVALLLAILVALISAELLSRRVRVMTTGLERLQDIRRREPQAAVIVLGNLTIPANSSSTFNGVIYVTGNYTQSAPSLVSGAVIVLGTVRLIGAGDFSEIDWDSSIVQQIRSQLGGYRFTRSEYIVP